MYCVNTPSHQLLLANKTGCKVLVTLDWLELEEQVGIVVGTLCPDDFEDSLADPVADPVVAHVDRWLWSGGA